jgi:hypothetical protein
MRPAYRFTLPVCLLASTFTAAHAQFPTWFQQAELASTIGAVSISGNEALFGEDDLGAYVFAKNGGEWTQQAELTEPNGSADGFGTSVAISGNIAAVGAPVKTVNGNRLQGAVYIFVKKIIPLTQGCPRWED